MDSIEAVSIIVDLDVPDSEIDRCGSVIDFIMSQQQEIERLKGDKWISVDDRLPNGKCLVWLKEKTLDRNIHSASFSNDGINYIGSYFEWDMKHNPITHWQPLPPEPKEG